MINVINNYYRPGPATNENMRAVFARIEQRSMYSPGSAWAEGGWYPKAQNRPGKWYVAGNVMHDNPEITNNNWAGMRGPENLARVNTAFEGWPVAPHQTALEAYESVLANAGATLPKRDAVDQRVTEMVRSGKPTTETGIIKDISEVGGYPELTYDPKKVPVDTDGDGMPDEWEKKHKLNPKDASDGAKDADKDGYTNVEEFLNGTNPNEYLNYRNLGNNLDMISFK
jgi:hypothetical protein